MKKKLTKAAVKKEINRILIETISKCVKLARANGYEICNSADSLTYISDDFNRFESGEDLLKEDSQIMFMQEGDIGYLQSLSEQAYDNDVFLASEADIKDFIKTYNDARALHFSRFNAEKKKARQDKIKKLRKQLAELEAEEELDK